MDLLLGNFVRKNINNLNDLELKDLDNLMQIEDETLQKWYFDRNHEKLIPINDVSKMFKKFKISYE